ncbi:glycosyltransferase family 4 protein [soil metagenome]
MLGPAHPLRGGIAAYNERLAREFQLRGDDVTLYSFSLQYPVFLFPGKTQYSNETAPTDLKIVTCVNSINPLNWIVTGLKLKKLKPDVLILRFWIPFMGPCLGTIARIVKLNHHTTIIAILDNIIPHEKRIGDKILSKYFLKSCDGFIAMSKQVIDDLISFLPSAKPLLIPHPVYDHYGDAVPKDVACKELNIDPEQKYILFFGFIRNYKGLDILLKAMAVPAMKSSGIKLIIAGEFYEDEQPYLTLIQDLGIKDQLILATSFIPDQRVKYYFSAASLVVQPYKSATQSGISQMAYHFLKPMVVTNVGGLPEIVPHMKTGYVVEISPIAVADAILDFFENNRENDFIEHLKIESKKYTWNRIVMGIDELSQSILKK